MLFLLKSKTGTFCTGFWFSSKRHKTCFSEINSPNCVMTYYFPRLFLGTHFTFDRMSSQNYHPSTSRPFWSRDYIKRSYIYLKILSYHQLKIITSRYALGRYFLETLELSHYPIRSYEGSIAKHSLYSKLYLFSIIVQLTLTFVVTLNCSLAMAKHLINDNEWHSWKQLYNKKYESDEEEKLSYTIWNETRKMIERHNSDKSKTYKLGMNQFGDMVLFFIQLIYFYRFLLQSISFLFAITS